MRTPAHSLSSSILIASAAGLLAVQTASAQFNQVWQVGVDNGTNSDFSQEISGTGAAPGSATALDDDYYFAGDYPGPIGTVAVNEPFANFERALVITDFSNRIHFNLAPDLAEPGTEFRLLIDFVSNDNGDEGIHKPIAENPVPFMVYFNGVEVFTGTVTKTAEFFATPVFTIGTGVNPIPAVTGDNVVTVARATDTGVRWIQFDYIRLETTSVPEPVTAASLAAGAMLLGFTRRRRG